MGQYGFSALDTLTAQLNGFQGQIVDNANIMKSQIMNETHSDELGGSGPGALTLGQKVDTIVKRLGPVEQVAGGIRTIEQYIETDVKTRILEYEKKLDAIAANMGTVMGQVSNNAQAIQALQSNTGNNNMGSNFNSNNTSGRYFSILECKSVQDMRKLGNDKHDWREWFYQLKNTL